MKRFKYIILLLLISIYSVGQDSIKENNIKTVDSILVHMSIDPMSITISSEPLERNEGLQKVLELETIETQVLNDNLKILSTKLDSTNINKINNQINTLDNYNIDIPATLKKQRHIWIISGIIYMLLLAGYFIVFETSDKTYWNIKTTRAASKVFMAIQIFSILICPYLLTVLFNWEIFAVNNISRWLF